MSSSRILWKKLLVHGNGGLAIQSSRVATVRSLSVIPGIVSSSSTAWTTPTTTTTTRHSFEAVRWLSSESSKSEGGEPKKEAEAEPAAEPSPEEDTATEESKEEEEDAPKSKEELLELEVKELKNQLLRSYAEQENTRKIASRDVESARQFAIKSFAKSLLDVSDNLSRALESVPAEYRTKPSEGVAPDSPQAVLSTLYEGIEMTDKGLIKAFSMNGLERYGEVGETFDPNKHDALFEYPDPEKTAGTIGQLMKPGFVLHKRVLRPAEVGVVKEA